MHGGAGQVAGDLDPSLSRRHLTTLKRAYLKLRYLVDAGCVLVGHGLKTDLRMLNIAVPPAQARAQAPLGLGCLATLSLLRARMSFGVLVLGVCTRQPHEVVDAQRTCACLAASGRGWVLDTLATCLLEKRCTCPVRRA